MSFKKLALVTAMFAATSGAYAMEAMDEEALAAATGQDGITVTITTPTAGITMGQVIHDKDGWTAADGNPATARGGAIVIGSVDGSTADAFDEMKIVLAGLTLKIDADGGNATGSAPFLNIGVGLTGTTTISTGDMRVASSTTCATGAGVGCLAPANTPVYSSVLMDSMDIVLNNTTMNIQLGAEPQGAMIKVATTMTGGLTINKMKLNDTGTSVAAPTSGSIAIDSQKITNATGVVADLSVNADVDVVADGLLLTLGTVGTGGMNVDIKGVRLGTSDYAAAELGGWTVGTNAGQANANLAASIGDIEIRGLNLNGTTIKVSGH